MAKTLWASTSRQAQRARHVLCRRSEHAAQAAKLEYPIPPSPSKNRHLWISYLSYGIGLNDPGFPLLLVLRCCVAWQRVFLATCVLRNISKNCFPKVLVVHWDFIWKRSQIVTMHLSPVPAQGSTRRHLDKIRVCVCVRVWWAGGALCNCCAHSFCAPVFAAMRKEAPERCWKSVLHHPFWPVLILCTTV